MPVFLGLQSGYIKGNACLRILINIIKIFAMPISGSYNGAYELHKSYETGRTCLVGNMVFLSCKEIVLDTLKYSKRVTSAGRSTARHSTTGSQPQAPAFEELLCQTRTSSPHKAALSGKSHD